MTTPRHVFSAFSWPPLLAIPSNQMLAARLPLSHSLGDRAWMHPSAGFVDLHLVCRNIRKSHTQELYTHIARCML